MKPERVWADKQGRLRWSRREKDYLSLVYHWFMWAKMVHPGLAIAAGSDGIYKVQWHSGSIEETLTITKIEHL